MEGVSSWLKWVRVKIERESLVLSELSECVGSFGRNEFVVMLGDLNLNARVGNEVIDGVV